MSGPAYMPFYPADYISDTQHLSLEQHGAYLLLILAYWRHGNLPTDEKKLALIAHMSPAKWKANRDTLEALFDHGWRHKRIEKELAKANLRIDKAAKAGEAGGTAKALKYKKPDVADARRELHPGASLALASSSDSDLRKKESKEERKETNNAREVRASSPWPSDAFNQFWTKYPHKVGRAACAAKLDKIRKGGQVTFEHLMEGLDRYVHKRDDRPWCNPQTWLNQGRWDDEPARSAAGGLSEAFDWLDDEIERRSSGASGGDYPRERFDAELRFDEPGGLFDPDYRH